MASPRNLSLKELKEIIQDIYGQKVKHDKKCMETKQPKETMAQFLHTYLNFTYGLKNLMQEWAKVIDEAIFKFSNIDKEVLLFGKILRNEFDEGFKNSIERIKELVCEGLKEGIKKKDKFRKEGEIEFIIETLAKGDGEIEEALWREVVKRMGYKENEGKIIEQRIKDLESYGKKKELKVKFGDFQEIITDIHFSRHEKLIMKFATLFKKYDLDSNGILNRNEFSQLAVEMKISKDEAEKLKEMLDPFRSEQIIFTECYAIFSEVAKINFLIKCIGEDFS